MTNLFKNGYRLFDSFDDASFLVVILDCAGVVLKVNKKTIETLGWERADIEGVNWFEKFVPDSARDDIRASFEKISSGHIEHLEVTDNLILTKDGKTHLVEWNNIVLRDDAGEIAGVCSFGVCVQKRKQAIQALVDSEARYRKLFDNATVGMYRSTPDGKYLMANTTLVKMLGYSSLEDLASTNINDLYHPDNPREIFQKEIEKSGEVKDFEIKFLTASGNFMYVSLNSKCVKDENGRLLYYEGCVENITDKKTTDTLLKEKTELENLLTSISTSFMNLESDKIIEGVNSALKLLGEFMGVDRAYVFQFVEDFSTMDNTYEWVRSGVEAKINDLKDLDVKTFAWSTSKTRKKEILHVERVSDLPDEATAEREEWLSEDIQSLIIVPLVCESKVQGFLGFDSVLHEKTWSESVISMLPVLGEVFASALNRKKIDDRLRLRVEFAEINNRISASFVNVDPENTDKTIEQALADIGLFINADRAFIYAFSEDGQSMRLTHKWQSVAVDDVLNDHEVVDLSNVTIDLADVLSAHAFNIQSISNSDSVDDAKVKAALEFLGCEFLCVPVDCDNSDARFLGFSSDADDKKWLPDIISYIRIVGEIFATAIDRQKKNIDLIHEKSIFSALFNNVPDHIYFKDLDSKFVRINQSQADFLGLKDVEDAVGVSDVDFFDSSHADRALEDEKRVMETGMPIVGKEEESLLKNGELVWESTTKVPWLNAKGEVIGTFGVTRDITEAKKREKENHRIASRMQHKQKLESLGILSGGIAHDLNNLLMGILGNAGLALRALDKESVAGKCVEQVETIAQRAADLANQMLSYAGKSKFVVKPCNLTSLVSEMAHLLEVSISNKVMLKYDFDDNLPFVEADATQIRQVVMNLITNASDAIGDNKGTISVTTGVEYCNAEYVSSWYADEAMVPGDYVCVRVEDDGVGMDKKTIDRIFDPFFTTKKTGRGLGLAAVLGIVRGHKGILRVYSEIGKGTVFKILIPCSQKQDVKTDLNHPVDENWKASGTVMVVDDNDVALTVTSQILSSLGFDVIECSECSLAVQSLHEKSKTIRAILLDVTMPDMSIVDVCKLIRGINKDIPIILISGYNEQNLSSDLSDIKYEGFIQKPFQPQVLLEMLSSILDQNRVVPA